MLALAAIALGLLTIAEYDMAYTKIQEKQKKKEKQGNDER